MLDDAPLSDAERRLIDFAPGQHFDGAIFAALDVSLRSASNGSPYLQLKLRDCTGERNAKLFSAPDDILQQLNGAKLVKVRGIVETNARFRGDFRLHSIQSQDEPDDLTPYLSPLPADHLAHKARFFDLIRSVKNPHLKNLLREVFDLQGELWTQFEVAPAARSMHHAHRGGLLEHSGEVALLCDRVASSLYHIDRDLLVTGALLHDIGKLEEMENDLSAGEYTPAGQLVGHIVLGTCTIATATEKIEGFPLKLKHEVMHLILSHHGEPEYGAARRPMCAEALILSLCDLMSAKVAQCREKAEGEEDFVKLGAWHGVPSAPQNAIYVGLMRGMMSEE